MTDTQSPAPARCIARTGAGQPCKGKALAGSPFCFAHAPELAPRRKLGNALGGLRSRKRERFLPDDAPLASAEDAMGVLRMALRTVLQEEPSLAQARHLKDIAEATVRILETSELARRLEALEGELTSERRAS